jgi:GT2 family glycosyltransferase
VTRVDVVCPVRDRIDLTRTFLANLDLSSDWRCLFVLDNGSGPKTQALLETTRQDWGARRVAVERRPDESIYELWNAGVDRARRQASAQRVKAWHVLVTNNDVELPASAIAELSRALDEDERRWISYPDYDAAMVDEPVVTGYRETTGVLGDGGMFGACFMVAGHRIPWIAEGLISDLGYEWWFGDNHLAREVELAGGRQVRVEGLPVHHVNEGTAMHHPELTAAKARDRARWIASNAKRRQVDRPRRRQVPGTIVWSPGGAQRVEPER